MPIPLYDHNQTAYKAALTLMNETGKAAIIHPTGTGKSFIAFKLAEQHSNKNGTNKTCITVTIERKAKLDAIGLQPTTTINAGG